MSFTCEVPRPTTGISYPSFNGILGANIDLSSTSAQYTENFKTKTKNQKCYRFIFGQFIQFM